MDCRLVVFLTILFANISFAQGFDSRYKAYVGDLNNDGYSDIYISRTPEVIILHGAIATPIVLPPDVEGFVLQQNIDQTFNIVSNLTSAQRYNASQWQESTAIQLILGDFNIDGIIDVLVSDIGQVIANARDQIVYVPNQTGILQLTLKSIDDTFISFVETVAKWVANPNYFEDNAPLIQQQVGTETVTEWYSDTPLSCYFDDCFFDFFRGWVAYNSFSDSYTPITECYIYACEDLGFGSVIYRFSISYQVPIYEMVPDYSGFNQNALNFATAMEPSMTAGEIDLQSSEAHDIQDILDEVYGPVIDIFGDIYDNIQQTLEGPWWHTKILITIGGIALETCVRDLGTFGECHYDMVLPGIDLDLLVAGCGSVGSYEITTHQSSLVQTLQRRNFWQSRMYDSCDPVAPIALAVVDDKGFGAVTNNWLRKVAQDQNVSINEEQIGYDVMEAHEATTNNDIFGVIHKLSIRQVSEYHHEVFNSHGLPDYTFGGTPWGIGSPAADTLEDISGNRIWCEDCDPVP